MSTVVLLLYFVFSQLIGSIGILFVFLPMNSFVHAAVTYMITATTLHYPSLGISTGRSQESWYSKIQKPILGKTPSHMVMTSAVSHYKPYLETEAQVGGS